MDSTTISMPPSPADVEKLKADWAVDPCFDLATAHGFGDYDEELAEYQRAKEQEWAEAREARRLAVVSAEQGRIERLTMDLDLAGERATVLVIDRLTRIATALEGSQNILALIAERLERR